MMRLVPLLALLLAVATTPLALAAPRVDAFEAAGIDSPPDAAVPGDLAFRDSRGRPVLLDHFLDGDRPVVLAPIYFDCPNICGLSSESLLHGLARTPLRPGEDYRVVFVSFDPTESPVEARVAREKALARVPVLRDAGDDALAFLSGAPAPTGRLLKAIGYRVAWDDQLQQYAHANAFAVLTPDGTLARWINAVAARPLDLRLAVVEAGQGTTGSLADFALMLCYHYDPKTGQYGAIIDGSLKTVAGLLVIGLGGYIGLSLWRERRGGRWP